MKPSRTNADLRSGFSGIFGRGIGMWEAGCGNGPIVRFLVWTGHRLESDRPLIRW